MLLTSPAAGQPMDEHGQVELTPGVGIEGDRYATKLGHWSDPRWPDQQLTMVEDELATELNLDPRQLRRNIVTHGVTLSDLIDREFTLGTARLRGVRPCDPCRYLETLTREGLFDELGGRGGLRVAVISGGTVRLGDQILR